VIALLSLNLLLVFGSSVSTAEQLPAKGYCELCIKNGDIYACCVVEVCIGGPCCSGPTCGQ
jgi:hypothetical protein